MKKRTAPKVLSIIMSLIIMFGMIPVMDWSGVFIEASAADTSLAGMTARAEALVNYTWTPAQNISTWNGSKYNGKTYFAKGETVKGVPYTLFTSEVVSWSLCSLSEYKNVASKNYSTTKYCKSVSDTRTGPVYGSCCADLVCEVFGGSFMNGSTMRYHNVPAVQNSSYATTTYNVKASNIVAGDALSDTGKNHIIWVGEVTDSYFVIYEQTPPVARKTTISKSSVNSNGYLVYGKKSNGEDMIYSTVTKSKEFTGGTVEEYANLGDEFYAYIKNVSKGWVLTNNGNISADNSTGLLNQIWKFSLLENGAYKIESAYDNSCMDVLGSSIKNGGNVHCNSEGYLGGENQQFYIVSNSDAWYLSPVHSKGNCFLNVDFETKNLQIYGFADNSEQEMFEIIKCDFNGTLPSFIGENFYAYVENQSTGLFLTNNLDNIAGEISTGYHNQIWKFTYLNNGAYKIESAYNLGCFDVLGSSNEGGTNVYAYSGGYVGEKNQEFYIYQKYDAYYLSPVFTEGKNMLDMNLSTYNLELWGQGEDWAPQEFNIIKCDFDGTLPSAIGANFYAYIENQSTGKYLTNNLDNIAGETFTGNYTQIWEFTYLYNGAYKIESAYNLGCFDVWGSSNEGGTNVYAYSGGYIGEKNQEFYIYQKYDAYYLSPVFTEGKNMLDMNLSTYNLELWGQGEDWAPQEFNIIPVEYDITYCLYDTDKSINEKKQFNTISFLNNFVPARTGYIFKCWNTKADGSGASYNPGDTYTQNADLTLYAIWEHDTFSLKNDTLNIDETNGFIYGTDLFGVTQTQLGAQFGNSNLKITINDKNRVGTGTLLELIDSDNLVYDTLTVVIFGDVNGDGWYDGNDAFLVNLIINGMLDKYDVGEAVWTAADCNHDGEINEADYELLMSAGLLLNDVDQSKPVAELITNEAYIEYMGLIDQSVETGTDTETNGTNTNDNVGQGLAPAETGSDFETILADIIAFVKQIFSFIFSLIFN